VAILHLAIEDTTFLRILYKVWIRLLSLDIAILISLIKLLRKK